MKAQQNIAHPQLPSTTMNRMVDSMGEHAKVYDDACVRIFCTTILFQFLVGLPSTWLLLMIPVHLSCSHGTLLLPRLKMASSRAILFNYSIQMEPLHCIIPASHRPTSHLYLPSLSTLSVSLLILLLEQGLTVQLDSTLQSEVSLYVPRHASRWKPLFLETCTLTLHAPLIKKSEIIIRAIVCCQKVWVLVSFCPSVAVITDLMRGYSE